jgi:hypothetical protein
MVMSTCPNRSTQNEAGNPGWVGRPGGGGCVLSCLTARLLAKGSSSCLPGERSDRARGRASGLGLGGGPTTVRFVRLSPGSGSSGWDAAVVQSAVCSVCDYCQLWENSGSAVGREERPSSCRGSEASRRHLALLLSIPTSPLLHTLSSIDLFVGGRYVCPESISNITLLSRSVSSSIRSAVFHSSFISSSQQPSEEAIAGMSQLAVQAASLRGPKRPPVRGWRAVRRATPSSSTSNTNEKQFRAKRPQAPRAARSSAATGQRPVVSFHCALSYCCFS